jgi:hypothetical protein
MRHSFAIVIMCVGNLALQAADTNIPVVKVDSRHQMMNYPAGTKPEIYRIRASSSLILDATDYNFDIPPELRDKPLNSVQVAQTKTHKFELTWQPGKTRFELSNATLHPLPGGQSFEGFKSGDKILVAIGVTSAPRKFAPVWTSIVEIE